MGTITPITQGIVYSATTQSTALTGTANTSPPAPSTSTTDASTSSISDKVINASGLYNVSIDLAGLTSQLQVAQTGTAQISSILQNLQGIAQQLSEGTGNTSDLESQFQTLYAQVEQIVAATSFDGSSLLDGSFSYSIPSSSGPQTSTIPDLSTQSLFGGAEPNVSTQAGATTALGQIANAENTVNGASSDLDSAANQLNFIMASVDTAQANSDAAGSTLSENELNNPGFVSFLSEMLEEPGTSATAQTGNMSGSLSSLLSEQ